MIDKARVSQYAEFRPGGENNAILSLHRNQTNLTCPCELPTRLSAGVKRNNLTHPCGFRYRVLDYICFLFFHLIQWLLSALLVLFSRSPQSSQISQASHGFVSPAALCFEGVNNRFRLKRWISENQCSISEPSYPRLWMIVSNACGSRRSPVTWACPRPRSTWA